MRALQRHAVAGLVAAGIGVAPTPADSQNYPVRPVRFICPFPSGDGVDLITRIVGAALGEAWGLQVIVDNRPGAGGTIGADIVAKAAPDGYTVLMGTTATLAIAPALYRKLPYDGSRDFAPVSMIGTAPNVLVVHPSAPARSVGEFLAYAKAHPRKINYGSAGVGTTLHLSMEMLSSLAGIDVVHVPYKGGGPALADLLGGNVMAMFGAQPLLLSHIKAGKVRALAVSSARRSALLPNVPTVAESGVPGFEVIVWYSMLAPAGTPATVLGKLNADMVKVLSAPEVQRRFAENGVEAAASTPAELAAFVKSETVKWAKAVRDSGARAD
ncbi:MAG: Bug family tripartite tricarboxylate transporter substrate binding protein [Burkholderiales bacterium]